MTRPSPAHHWLPAPKLAQHSSTVSEAAQLIEVVPKTGAEYVADPKPVYVSVYEYVSVNEVRASIALVRSPPSRQQLSSGPTQYTIVSSSVSSDNIVRGGFTYGRQSNIARHRRGYSTQRHHSRCCPLQNIQHTFHHMCRWSVERPADETDLGTA